MSRKHRPQARPPDDRPKPGKTTATQPRPGGGRATRLVAVLCLVLAAMAATWVLWFKPDGARLPVLATDGLEPSLAALIQRRLDAVNAEPANGRAWGELGGLLKSLDYKAEAKVCLTEAERLMPEDPRWPYHLALLDRRDAPEAAIARLRKAARMCGTDPEIPRLRLAQWLAESGREPEAEKALEPLVSAKPDCAPARLLMARLEQRRGQWAKALTWAEGCVTNAHTARSAWTLTALLRQRLGDTNAAHWASRRALAAAPDVPWPDPFEEEILEWRGDARSLSDRAQAHLMAGRANQALPLAQRLVREHPEFAESWLMLGRAQVLRRQPDEAEAALRRHLELDPDSLNGWFQLGMTQLARQQFDEAAQTFRKATTLKKDFGPAYFNLGFALAKAGRTREAVAPFEEAIRQSPEMIDAYILLADLHVQHGEQQRAGELAELASRIDASDPRLPHLRSKIGSDR